ncbi:MAG: DUF3343 domain-containing protein [Desulfuromonadaceae bacterium]|nr:DUF3343 domain-containing protein [Desulfuromonadaceae bacterium]
MVKDGDCVAIFHTIHRVMKAEKILKTENLEILLIPIPRQLSSDCGLAIRFAQADRQQLESLLAETDLAIAEIWQKQAGEFRRLS